MRQSPFPASLGYRLRTTGWKNTTGEEAAAEARRQAKEARKGLVAPSVLRKVERTAARNIRTLEHRIADMEDDLAAAEARVAEEVQHIFDARVSALRNFAPPLKARKNIPRHVAPLFFPGRTPQHE